MFKRILHELKNHAPFTSLGAISGIVLMVYLKSIPHDLAYKIFYILHPLHVLLSAMVTTAIYNLYECRRPGGRCNIFKLIIIGYVGSIGIATLSDCLIPYLGEVLLGLPNRGMHIGFIEEWWIVNPLAFVGIALGYFKPATKFPHSGHVMLSTWASLFHMIMALGFVVYWYTYVVIGIFLFISVWIPCCVSDIVFPLLFVGKNKRGKIKHSCCSCG